MRPGTRSKCLACEKELSQANRKFCSNRCCSLYRYRRYIERWKAGIESGLQKPYGISNHVRRYLIEKYGEKCSRCGWCERNQTTSRVPLNVDHIDGDWRNCSEENLTLLCPNCHSLTPTYGALNKGRGRAERYS